MGNGVLLGPFVIRVSLGGTAHQQTSVIAHGGYLPCPHLCACCHGRHDAENIPLAHCATTHTICVLPCPLPSSPLTPLTFVNPNPRVYCALSLILPWDCWIHFTSMPFDLSCYLSP